MGSDASSTEIPTSGNDFEEMDHGKNCKGVQHQKKKVSIRYRTDKEVINIEDNTYDNIKATRLTNEETQRCQAPQPGNGSIGETRLQDKTV